MLLIHACTYSCKFKGYAVQDSRQHKQRGSNRLKLARYISNAMNIATVNQLLMHFDLQIANDHLYTITLTTNYKTTIIVSTLYFVGLTAKSALNCNTHPDWCNEFYRRGECHYVLSIFC